MTVRSSNSTLAGPGGPGAGGDHDLVRGGPADPALAAVHFHGVRVEEAARAGHGRDPVAGQLAAHHVHLAADHVGGPGGQVGDGDLVLDPVALPVHLPLVQAGQVENRLAQGLGRDRARVQAHAADHVLALDDPHSPLELRRGDGSLLAARARADHQHVEVVHMIQCDDRRPPFEPLRAAFRSGASYAGTVRLVSLLPSATEIVYALGLGDDLAGVTFECDEPPAARAEKTIVVGGRDTSGMTPGDIDRYVRAQMASGQDLYTLHARALAELAARPDPDPGPVPGLRAPVRAGRRRPGLPGLPRGRADPGPALARRGTGLDPGRRAAGRGRRTRRAAGRRAPRPAGPGRGERGRAGRPSGGRARVGGSAVHRRALGPRSGHRAGGRPVPVAGAGAGAASVQTELGGRRRGRAGPRRGRAVRLPPARRDRAGAGRRQALPGGAGVGDRRRRHRGPPGSPAGQRRRRRWPRSCTPGPCPPPPPGAVHRVR